MERRNKPLFEQPLSDVILDPRRVAYFPEHELLCAADLHLGYAWCHRASGQLMPITPADNSLTRLRVMLAEFGAKRLVLLGDIVHRALPVAALMEQIRDLAKLATETELILLVGNHDKRLGKLDATLPLRREYRAGQHLFLHGDLAPAEKAERYIIGHEHPGISLGDGVATSRRYPCFVFGGNVLALPAFSNWSANSGSPRSAMMSPLWQASQSRYAVAILGQKLLKVPLSPA